MATTALMACILPYDAPCPGTKTYSNMTCTLYSEGQTYPYKSITTSSGFVTATPGPVVCYYHCDNGTFKYLGTNSLSNFSGNCPGVGGSGTTGGTDGT